MGQKRSFFEKCLGQLNYVIQSCLQAATYKLVQQSKAFLMQPYLAKLSNSLELWQPFFPKRYLKKHDLRPKNPCFGSNSIKSGLTMHSFAIFTTNISSNLLIRIFGSFDLIKTGLQIKNKKHFFQKPHFRQFSQ